MGWAQPWTDAYLRQRWLWSCLQAALTCGLTLLLGLPLAWVLARREFAGRAWVLRALMLPFVVPTVVAALGILALLGPNGWLAACGGPDLQGTPWLLLYGNVFFNLCLVVRAGVQGLEQVSTARYGVARTLGATPWRAFWRVEWPAMAPWLMSALCLVFVYCFSGFGLALMLGGQAYATVEVEIYTLVAHELQLGTASVLALWALWPMATVALGYALLQRAQAAPQRADTLARRAPQGLAQWLAVALALGVLGLCCGLPLLALLIEALGHVGNPWAAGSAGGVGGVGGVEEGWAVLWAEDSVAALWNTLRFSGMALALATLLGVLHALAAQHALLLRALAYAPLVVSPVVVGFGMLLLYPTWTASLGLLVVAYALLAYPFVAQSLAAALDSLPANLGDVARTLGATPRRVFWRVTFPLLLPALRRGMAFAAATAVGEFAVTLFLSRPEWATLSTLVYHYLGRPGEANRSAALLLSCLLMALALLAFWVLERMRLPPWGPSPGVPTSLETKSHA